ncbi:MAG: LarC family nickel insertion protein, partial [Geodermatophilaceae bacterium]|nr:LarC family nickel insertion protein [Geodermatophilaceae bacterium]
MIGWLDCSAGASGDMLLGALVDAGAPMSAMQEAVDALAVEPVLLSASQVTRQGIAATKVDVAAPRSTVTRTWANIRGQLEGADIPEPVRCTALDAFARLARAEATAHRTSPEQVHFHEVGGLDAIADVVGTAAGLHALGIRRLTAGTVALGSGMVRGEHGLVPVPGPAVLALLQEAAAPVWAGPAPYEMCTP